MIIRSRPPALALRALLVFLCLRSAATAESKKDTKKRQKDDDDESRLQPLPRHSFQTPLEYQSLLDDWMLSGSSLFERDRMMLHPGVPGLAGFAYNKQAIRTADWRATFQFRVTGLQDKNPPADQTFAFWYVQDNVTKSFDEAGAIKSRTWVEGLQAQGMTFSGAKARFQGFGAVFSLGSNSPSVSLVTNDGTQDLSPSSALPGPHTKAFNFRGTLNPAQFKIRVKGNTVKGFVKDSPSLAWQECFSVDNVNTKAGGFMGFSAWSGSSDGAPDLVSVLDLKVVSFDDTVMGEEMKDVSAQIQDAYKEMLLDEKRHFADQKAQTDHINRLITMMEDNMKNDLPHEQSLITKLQTLEQRMEQLGQDCGTVAREARILLEQNPGSAGAQKGTHADHVKALKDEIVGLRKTLVKDSVSHRAKVSAVQKNLKEVKMKSEASSGSAHIHKIKAQTKVLEKTVSSRGSTMSWMLICMIIAVLAVGGLMYNRMSYYEKKHFL